MTTWRFQSRWTTRESQDFQMKSYRSSARSSRALSARQLAFPGSPWPRSPSFLLKSFGAETGIARLRGAGNISSQSSKILQSTGFRNGPALAESNGVGIVTSWIDGVTWMSLVVSGKVEERSYKVLVADDDEFVHALIKVSLRNTNYRLAFVKSGVEALDMIKAHPPDIVIADGMMPELSGFELVEDMKRCSQTAAIPVILLTALDEPRGLAAAAAGLRADLQLAKPFRVGTILNCLKKAERLVEAHRAARTDARRANPAKFYVRWRLGM